MLFEIVVILLLVLANGVFAGTEAAMIAARRGRLQQAASEGRQGAAIAVHLQNDPNRFLSTVQIGITLIGIMAGAFGGVSLAARLASALALLPFPVPYAENIAFFLVVLLITYFSLVIGELVPKRLALQSAEAIAIRMARPMLFLSQISRPIIVGLTWSTNGLLALLGRRNVVAEEITEADIRQMVHAGTLEGVVEPQEQQIIERVFDLGERLVRHVVTPRVDVYAVPADAALISVLDELLDSGFSRFPVYEQDLDHVVGIVHVRDLLRLYRAGEEGVTIRAAMYPAIFVPESRPAADLLPLFRRSKQHMAMVINEHGGIDGLVTLEDVLEEIVGDITDEYDRIEEQAIVRRDERSYLVDGSLPIDHLKEFLGVEELPEEEHYRFDTLAGFILTLLGRIPRVGETVVWRSWTFEVVDMDGLRIDRVLVTRKPDHGDRV